MSKNPTDAKASQTVQTAAEQPLPMKVDVKIGSIRPEGSVRAFASINLNDCFAIRNVKVVDSTKGLFVAMPSYKAGNGEYKDICFPCTKESKADFDRAVLSAYEQTMAQKQQGQTQEAAVQEAQGQQMAGM